MSNNCLFPLLLLILLPFNLLGVDQRIPKFMRDSIMYEQEYYMEESGNEKYFARNTNRQNSQYKPKNGQVFEVQSYWVDETLMSAVASDDVPETVKKQFTRMKGGRRQYRLLVHPESEKFYKKVIDASELADTYLATPTASGRTLLVWRKGQENSAFFGKLSLDRNFGEVRRTISNAQVVRSIGTQNIIHSSRRDLPQAVSFMPEQFGLILNGEKKGGMIIRTIPESVRNMEEQFIPFFSIYADPSDSRQPLLLKMIERSGMGPQDFVREKIFRPYIEEWMELAIVHGFVGEDHAQNLLIGVDRAGDPNGLFRRRDYGGFIFDLNYRMARGLKTPNLPTVGSVWNDYLQKFSVSNIENNLNLYFRESIVYDIETQLRRWQRTGKLKGKKIAKGDIYRIFKEEVENAIKLRVGHSRPRSKRLKDRVAAARRSLLPKSRKHRAAKRCTTSELNKMLQRVRRIVP